MEFDEKLQRKEYDQMQKISMTMWAGSEEENFDEKLKMLGEARILSSRSSSKVIVSGIIVVEGEVESINLLKEERLF